MAGDDAADADAELADLLAGIDHVGGLPHQRPPRALGVVGASHGGRLALLALARTDRFAAGVALSPYVHPRAAEGDGGGVCVAAEDGGRGGGGGARGRDRRFGRHRRAAPAAPLSSATACARRATRASSSTLHSRGVPTELVLYPEEGHTVELPRDRRDAARRVCAWLLEHVPVAE